MVATLAISSDALTLTVAAKNSFEGLADMFDAKKDAGLPYRFGRKRRGRVSTTGGVMFGLISLAIIANVVLVVAKLMQ